MEKSLRDKDVSVMMATLPYYNKRVKENPDVFKSKLYIFLEIFQ